MWRYDDIQYLRTCVDSYLGTMQYLYVADATVSAFVSLLKPFAVKNWSGIFKVAWSSSSLILILTDGRAEPGSLQTIWLIICAVWAMKQIQKHKTCSQHFI